MKQLSRQRVVTPSIREQNLNDIERAYFAEKGVIFRIFRCLIIVLSYVVFTFVHCSSLVARVMGCHSKKE